MLGALARIQFRVCVRSCVCFQCLRILLLDHARTLTNEMCCLLVSALATRWVAVNFLQSHELLYVHAHRGEESRLCLYVVIYYTLAHRVAFVGCLLLFFLKWFLFFV